MKIFISSFLCAFVIVLAVSCSSDDDPIIEDDCMNVNVSYSTDLVSVINSSCAISNCHVAGFGFGDFTSYDGIKAKADDGSLRREVVINQSMPVTGSISQSDRDNFKCWIEAGAPNN